MSSVSSSAVFAHLSLFSIDPVHSVLSLFAPVSPESSSALLSSESGTALDSSRSGGSRQAPLASAAFFSWESWVTLLSPCALWPQGPPRASGSFWS